jgi:SulP family sulfate permease
MLVAVPAAIANGLVMYAPLGPSATAAGAMAGIVGAAALGMVAPFLGGTPRLVSAPSPAAAAFMAAVAADLLGSGLAPGRVPAIFVLTALVAGAFQLAVGSVRGGRLVKYLPYPVVAGYLTGAGLLILYIQIPRLLGVTGSVAPLAALLRPASWSPTSIAVAGVTLLVAVLAPRVTRRIPATLVGIAAGALVYRAFAAFQPPLLQLAGNPQLVGLLPGSGHLSALGAGVSTLRGALLEDLRVALVPGLTLGVLVSIDTLKTCLLVDSTTGSRHDPDRELLGQGLANVASALAGGAPGTGIVSGSMVNVAGGATGKLSGFLAGLFALGALLLFGDLVAYLPVPALAAIVALMAVRMFQRNAFQLMRERRTALDFAVVVAVVATAMSGNLVAAAGVGVALSVGLYVREQARAPLVRRVALGDAVSSKRRRLDAERAVIAAHGAETALVELQGSLFFGTAEKVLRVLQPHLARRTLILDLGRLPSVDVTGANALQTLAAGLGARGGRLVLCDLPGGVAGQRLAIYLGQLGLLGPPHHVRVFSTADDALEWAEEELIARHLPARRAPDAPPLALHEMELLAGLPSEAHEALRPHVTERAVGVGERLFSRGDVHHDLFFIRAGSVRITVPVGGGRAHALATFGRGDFFGEIAFVDGNPRTADAVADAETHLYALTREGLASAAREHPAIEQLLHARLARALATRLRAADLEVQALKLA